MSDNTLQFKWIYMLATGFHRLFLGRQDVFVASDLLWYPVEGDPKIRLAPDTMIVFGVPPGDRGSYKRWEEGNVVPQVVFEVLSPGNTVPEMRSKARRYEALGVEEYYEFDPTTGNLDGYCQENGTWKWIDNIQGYVSPRTKVTFSTEGENLIITDPNGKRFLHFDEELYLMSEMEVQRAEAEAQRSRADAEALAAAEAKRRNALLEAKMRELGIDPTSL
jgi:Uma2 family endonuclease